MKTRSHHKVRRESIYFNKETDAPWPAKAYFIRLALFVAELVSLASWCLIIPLIEAHYERNWGILWERTRPLLAILGIGFSGGAMALSINPLAIPLSTFKNLLAWTSPPGFVWKILRALLRPLKPTAPLFFERFLLLIMIGISVISWNFVPYLIHRWIPFSLDWWDRLVVRESIMVLPVSCLINLLLDRLKWTKKSAYIVSQLLQTIFNIVSPVAWFYHLAFRPVVLFVCRLRYGYSREPDWL